MLDRLGVQSVDEQADIDLANASFRALAEGGEALRWEPFFFDWFCGREERALAGPRADLYAEPAFEEFRQRLAGYEAERPERLKHPYFAQPEPEELLIDQIEALWGAIADTDDWTPFETKLAGIEMARQGWDFAGTPA
jgi:hypothetical protein